MTAEDPHRATVNARRKRGAVGRGGLVGDNRLLWARVESLKERNQKSEKGKSSLVKTIRVRQKGKSRRQGRLMLSAEGGFNRVWEKGLVPLLGTDERGSGKKKEGKSSGRRQRRGKLGYAG